MFVFFISFWTYFILDCQLFYSEELWYMHLSNFRVQPEALSECTDLNLGII